MKVFLLALALLFVTSPVLAEDSMFALKSRTILAGPEASSGPTSTIGALKQLFMKTRIKGFGLRTHLGGGVSVRAGLSQRETGKARPNILGSRRGLSPKRGTGPAIEFKIKF